MVLLVMLVEAKRRDVLDEDTKRDATKNREVSMAK